LPCRVVVGNGSTAIAGDRSTTAAKVCVLQRTVSLSDVLGEIRLIN
jgi:hypothetical protein